MIYFIIQILTIDGHRLSRCVGRLDKWLHFCCADTIIVWPSKELFQICQSKFFQIWCLLSHFSWCVIFWWSIRNRNAIGNAISANFLGSFEKKVARIISRMYFDIRRGFFNLKDRFMAYRWFPIFVLFRTPISNHHTACLIVSPMIFVNILPMPPCIQPVTNKLNEAVRKLITNKDKNECLPAYFWFACRKSQSQYNSACYNQIQKNWRSEKLQQNSVKMTKQKYVQYMYEEWTGCYCIDEWAVCHCDHIQ